MFKSALSLTFNPEDYVLSFRAEGISIVVTDIHREAYQDLEVLYIINQGLFKQYFTKKAFERAQDRGVLFYSDEQDFDNYKQRLEEHIESFKQFFSSQIKNKNQITVRVLEEFLASTVSLCREYAKMNFEFTDKAFTLKDKNKTIDRNLTTVATFKDQVRIFMNLVLFNSGGYLDTLFSILSRQFSLSRNVLENLAQQELLDLFNNVRPDEFKVLKRQEAFVEIYNRELPYEGEAAKAIVKRFREETIEASYLTGQVANKGKVSGRVKIIPVDYNDMNRMNHAIGKMEHGDILVAETTAPELMTACRKAAAIITDLGGLLSHAAIVSRELGIPCIVDTKIATKALHDGDLVEINASKGIITVLEKV